MAKLFKVFVSIIVLSMIVQALGLPHAWHHYREENRIQRDRLMMIDLARIAESLARGVSKSGAPASTSLVELAESHVLSAGEVEFLKHHDAVLRSFNASSPSNTIVVEIPRFALVGLKRGIGMRALDARNIR